jgi:hypothetical protein
VKNIVIKYAFLQDMLIPYSSQNGFIYLTAVPDSPGSYGELGEPVESKKLQPSKKRIKGITIFSINWDYSRSLGLLRLPFLSFGRLIPSE